MHTLGELLGEKGYIRGPFGSSLKRGEMKDAGIPVYEQQHAINNSRAFKFFIDDKKFNEMKRFMVKENDLIVSCSGTIGRISIIRPQDPTGIISQALLILRPNNAKILPEYLRYYFSTNEGFSNLTSASHGSVQVNIASRDIVERIEIEMPSIPVQSRIVSILSALDEKIRLNRQTNATLEAIAQTIFKEWFVDFNFPGAIGEIQDSELGPIPKGWRAGTLGDTFSITMGQSPPGESYNEIGEGVPFFQGRADFNSRFPTKRVFTTEPKRYAKKFDTLVSVRAPVGDMNIATEDCCIGRGLSSVIHRKGYHSFTYYCLKELTATFKGFEDNGTVFGSINKSEFEAMACTIPNENDISAFENTCHPIDDIIFSNEKQTAVLTTIRNTLLPKLISGEIRVKDAEEVVEAIL
jgi:type I restriction enzyme, S subunit